MSHKKVRFASGAPGLFLLAGGVAILSACGPQKQEKEPAARVELTDAAYVPDAEVPQTADTDEAPGFASVAETPKPAATVALPAPNGEQSVGGTIIDFLCKPDTPVSSEDAVPSASCELVIRTETRGDRRMLCDVAPCDAWVSRGSLPQGIRGLQAEVWFTLADRYDSSGVPMGRLAKVTRLTVVYSKPSG
jgi:hypothetical protein